MERSLSSGRLEELLAHRAWVRRVARALVLDESRADDLEQEVWLSALRVETPRAPKAWLGTVLRRIASNMRRDEGRQRVHESLTAPPVPLPGPQERIERTEVIERVARAVRTLEEPYGTAIFLRYFEDLSPPEIASRLGAPLETVRTRLRRGLAILRERLDAEEKEGSRKWALLLLPLVRETVPGHPPAVAGGSALATAAGVLAMGVKSKVAVAAALLVLLGTGTWLLQSGPEQDAGERSTRIGSEPLVARSRVERAPADSPGVPTSAVGAAPTKAVQFLLQGRVEDETGAPVEGATVSLLLPTGEKSEEQWTTDAQGRFSVARDDPPKGPWTFRVEAPGPPEAWRSPVQDEVARSAGRILVVVLRRRTPGASGAFLRAEIVDATSGAPCEASRVTLVGPPSAGAAARGLPVSLTPGLATAEGLTPGGWWIRAEVPNKAVAVRKFLVGQGDAEASLRLEIVSTGTLAGRVDLGDTPVADRIYAQLFRRVDLADGAPPWGTGGALNYVTDFAWGPADREFSFKGLAPGEYVVFGYGARANDMGSKVVGRVAVEVRPGETTTAVVRVQPAALVMLQWEGRVPANSIEFWVASGDGPLELYCCCGGGNKAEGLNRHGPVQVPAGKIRWKARFLSYPDATETIEAREGSCTLAAGEEVGIPPGSKW